MIMTVAELRQYVMTDEADQVLLAKLKALESLVRAYCNNKFQNRNVRVTASVQNGVFGCSACPFKVGETVEVSESIRGNGLYTVKAVGNNWFAVEEQIDDESAALCTLVHYPADVVFGVANMVNWDLTMGDKVGVESETISRHTVNYANMNNTNAIQGYPRSLLGFLAPYRKVRFGNGVGI